VSAGKKLLEGKVMVVTGAGRGVGRGIARLAAAHGASVVVNDLGGSASGEGQDMSPAQSVVAEIEAAGGKAVANADSIATWASAQRIIEQAVSTFGRIDAVVNNAGILRDAIFHKMDPKDFDEVIDVHLKGYFYVSRAAAPHFRQQQSGRYIHMSSSSGLIGNLGQANYMAAKMGVVGLSKSIATDMGRAGVTSNCIAPFAWTRLVGTIPTDTPEAKARIEINKRMDPDKIAPLTVALASEAAAKVTGQVFGSRNNEIYLFNDTRPIKTAHTSEGWTPETVLERVFPMMAASFTPLQASREVFCWDPV
jgi:NAD(P)-dependent dehydrogenase (short-subunit alcohol dehydrogenase family)